jgi:hypothetical protein
MPFLILLISSAIDIFVLIDSITIFKTIYAMKYENICIIIPFIDFDIKCFIFNCDFIVLKNSSMFHIKLYSIYLSGSFSIFVIYVYSSLFIFILTILNVNPFLNLIISWPFILFMLYTAFLFTLETNSIFLFFNSLNLSRL